MVLLLKKLIIHLLPERIIGSERYESLEEYLFG